MTTVGQAVFGMYSLISTVFLIVFNIKKMEKEGEEGWELIALIPVLIFLANVI